MRMIIQTNNNMATLKQSLENLGEKGGKELLLEKVDADNLAPEGKDGPGITSDKPKRQQRQHSKKEKGHCHKDNASNGIGPLSPTIYLLPFEKEYLKKLEAYIQYSEGKCYSDHELVFEALQLWVVRNCKDFKLNDINKTKDENN